jgi:hypothetical protein
MPTPFSNIQSTVSIGNSSRNPYYYKFEVNQGRSAFIGANGNDQFNILQVVSGYNSPNFSNGLIHYMSFSHERFDNNEEHGVINTIQYQNPSGPATAKHMLLQKVSGNVGIGYFNSAPTEKLEVIGNIKTSNDIIFNNGRSLIQTLANIGTGGTGSGTGNFWFGTTTGIKYGNFQINTNGNTTLSNGVVAIGTTNIPNTDYALRVNGKILAKGLKVQITGWPDYVFEPNYALMPLQELSKYIATNKHLPNVPSQPVAEAEGVDVGDMNKVLLQKIEELTLYILQLENRMRTLEATK